MQAPNIFDIVQKGPTYNAVDFGSKLALPLWKDPELLKAIKRTWTRDVVAGTTPLILIQLALCLPDYKFNADDYGIGEHELYIHIWDRIELIALRTEQYPCGAAFKSLVARRTGLDYKKRFTQDTGVEMNRSPALGTLTTADGIAVPLLVKKGRFPSGIEAMQHLRTYWDED